MSQKSFFDDDRRLKQMFGIKKNQEPLTRFIDNIDAVQVELINWPDEERAKRHLINFAAGSWFEDFSKISNFEDYNAALNELMDGKILAQGLEGLQFSFLVKGLSLHGSHAIVRTRIGAAYLQQSQAVTDYRHSDILVPRAFQKKPNLLIDYQHWCIAGKKIYSNMLDSETIAVTDARFAMSKTVPVWVNISMTLPTILSVYSKRTDVTEEHPEMNAFAELLRIEIENKFPWMSGYFKPDNNCIHRFPGYRSNCVFKRDGKDKLLFEETGAPDNWTLHDKTKYELMLKDLNPVKTTYFHGFEKITEDEYNNLKGKYGIA